MFARFDRQQRPRRLEAGDDDDVADAADAAAADVDYVILKSITHTANLFDFGFMSRRICLVRAHNTSKLITWLRDGGPHGWAFVHVHECMRDRNSGWCERGYRLPPALKNSELTAEIFGKHSVSRSIEFVNARHQNRKYVAAGGGG